MHKYISFQSLSNYHQDLSSGI